MDVPTASPRAIYDALCQVPDDKVAEILDGELIVTPRPALRHASASSGLGGLLWGPFQAGRGGPGGWWILDEPEIHLADDVVVPDLAGWRRERLPAIPDRAFLALAPDWVCEVLSPATVRMDRSRKMRIYGRERVGYVWLLDPIVRTLEVLRLEGVQWLLVGTHDGTEPVNAEPFEATSIDLAMLWPDPVAPEAGGT